MAKEERTYSLVGRTGNLINMTQSQKRRIIYNNTLSLIVAAIKKCPNPEDIDHGSVGVVDSIRYIYANYSCDRGHTLREQSRRYCDLLTEEWEGPAPTCEECKLTTIPIVPPWDIMFNIFNTLCTVLFDCGHPGNVTNGTVDISNGTELHATVWYTCDEEFILNGSRSRTCGSDDRWSGTTPTCEGETLPKIPHVGNVKQ